MVVVHGFDVRLVDAFTNNPFPMHQGLDGEVYVEAEPDAEYFVVVRKVQTSSTKVVIVYHEVDGKKIPGSTTFYHHDGLGTELELGIRQFHKARSYRELFFEKKAVLRDFPGYFGTWTQKVRSFPVNKAS
jgi:hypothetical protein